MLKYILAGSTAAIAIGAIALQSDLACEYVPFDISYINDCQAVNTSAAVKTNSGADATEESAKTNLTSGSQEIAQKTADEVEENTETETNEADGSSVAANSDTDTTENEATKSNTAQNEEAATTVNGVAVPTFDIVRVEPDGSTLVAGRGEPNSTIILRDGLNKIGEALSNESGEWVIIVDEPIQTATATLSLLGMMADGTSIESSEIVNIAMRNDGTASLDSSTATADVKNDGIALAASSADSELDMGALADKLAAMNAEGGVTLDKLAASDDVDLKALAMKLTQKGSDGKLMFEGSASDEIDFGALASKMAEINKDSINVDAASSASSIDLATLASKLSDIKNNDMSSVGEALAKDEVDLDGLAAKFADMSKDGMVSLESLAASDDLDLQMLASKLANVGKDGMVSIESLVEIDDDNLNALAQKLKISNTGGLLTIDDSTSSDVLDTIGQAVLAENEAKELLERVENLKQEAAEKAATETTVEETKIAETETTVSEAEPVITATETAELETPVVATEDNTDNVAQEIKTDEVVVADVEETADTPIIETVDNTNEIAAKTAEDAAKAEALAAAAAEEIIKIAQAEKAVVEAEALAAKATEEAAKVALAEKVKAEAIIAEAEAEAEAAAAAAKVMEAEIKAKAEAEAAKIVEAAEQDATPLVVITEKGKAAKVLQGAGIGSQNNEMTFNSMDYDDKGAIIFSGDAKANEVVRVYINNEFVGEAITNPQGRWTLDKGYVMQAGPNSMRFDQVDGQGNVTSRRVTDINMPQLNQMVAATNGSSSGETNGDSDVSTANSQTNESSITTEDQTAVADSDAQTIDQTVADAGASQANGGRAIIIWGDNLWNISRKIYGKGELYTTIFKANKDQIRDPNLIYPGQVFILPSVADE